MNAHNVGNLAERLLLHVRCRLVLAVHYVHLDELERDFELVEDGRDAASAGRLACTIEFENCHFLWRFFCS
jgi:hypothetical protein